MKLPRLLAVSFLTLGTSFFFLPTAQAEQTGPATITCAREDGTQRTANVGWDNSQTFFQGKGDIARLYCEGGFSGGFPIFISTSVPDGPLRYYNGVAPTPEPTPTSNPTVEPTPAPSPSPSDGATATVNPAPTPEPSPSPSVTPEVSPSPEPTVVPSPSPEPSNTAPLPEPSPTPSDTSTATSETSTPTVEPPPVVPETQPTPEPLPIPTPVPVTPPEPTPTPVPQPQPQPEPTPEPPAPVVTPQPEPVPVPQPLPEPLPQPEPEPVPVEPAPEPAPEPVEPAPEPVPIPEPEEVPGPVVPEPAPEPAPEPPAIEPEPPVVPDVVPVATEDSTPEERAAVAEALIEGADGEPVTAEAIQEAGLTYEDLPPDTPVEVRQDENGNEVVITAEVAAALVVLESPAALVEAIFTDPGQALLALASIGADMSNEEREEAEKIIVASVIAGQAAVNAASMAGAAAAYRRNP